MREQRYYYMQWLNDGGMSVAHVAPIDMELLDDSGDSLSDDDLGKVRYGIPVRSRARLRSLGCMSLSLSLSLSPL